MNNIEIISDALKRFEINNYKVVEINVNEMMCSLIDQQFTYTICDERYYNIIFEHKGITLRFKTSSNCSEHEINSMILNCIEIGGNNTNILEQAQISHKGIGNIEHTESSYNDYEKWLTELYNMFEEKFQTIFNIGYELRKYYCQVNLSSIPAKQSRTDSNLYLWDRSDITNIIKLSPCYPSDNIMDLFDNKQKSKKNALALCNTTLKGHVLFKADAVAQLLNGFIRCFYADMLYKKQSPLAVNDIHNKQFERNFDLISLPYEELVFDSEGFATETKYLIKNGRVVDILGNSFFSELLGFNCIGNADLLEAEKVQHQRLKFLVHSDTQEDITIDNICDFDIHSYKITHVEFQNGTIFGIIVAYDRKNTQQFTSQCTMSFDRFFKSIIFGNREYKWSDNIYTSDILLSL